MTDNSRVAPLLLKENPWSQQDSPIWLCTTLSLIRNVQKLHFPTRLDDEERKQLLSVVGEELSRVKGLQNPQLFKMEECSARDKELLFEHFLSTHPYVHPQPGEGFLIDEGGHFLAAINMEDHLEFTRLELGDEMEQSLARLVGIESEIGNSLNYAFSPTYGFLTSNPAHAGTALIARIFLQIPAIRKMGLLEQCVEQHKTEFVHLTDLSGGHGDFVGDIVVITNNYTLGVSEESIFSELRTFATHLLVEEKGQRTKLHHDERPDVKDQVSRAYGLIKHSYLIETYEALNALSLLKLGLDVGWITGTNRTTLNELFFNCRRAHLLCLAGDTVPQESLSHYRALYLRKELDKLQLSV